MIASAYGFLRNLRKILQYIFLTASVETFLDYARDMKIFEIKEEHSAIVF